jgi:hypothetical protein
MAVDSPIRFYSESCLTLQNLCSWSVGRPHSLSRYGGRHMNLTEPFCLHKRKATSDIGTYAPTETRPTYRNSVRVGFEVLTAVTMKSTRVCSGM